MAFCCSAVSPTTLHVSTKEQYDTLKSLFWKDGIITGLKEYHGRRCYLGVDIDAGPILFELSPSGTAFMTGAATYFHDSSIRKDILPKSCVLSKFGVPEFVTVKLRILSH